MNFVESCNVYVGRMVIKAAKRIFNSDKICRSYSDLNFVVTFFGTQCIMHRCKLYVVLEHYKPDCASLHEMASLCVLNTKYSYPFVFMTVICFL